MARSPVLIYLVTEDWYFLSHRLPMAHAARQAGYEVHVITHLNGHGDAIAAHGFQVHPLPDWRGRLDPLRLMKIVRDVRRLYRRLAPDLVHHVALQSVVIGSLAATGLPVVSLNALAGVGFVFTSGSRKARAMRLVLTALLRWMSRRPRTAMLVQNRDDGAAMVALGVAPERIFMIGGSGVDTASYRALPEPDGPVTAAFVGRLLDDKGVRTLIAAHDLLRQRGSAVRLLIAGEPDPANPASIPADEIAAWKQRPNVFVLGHVQDISGLWASAHIAVLPSRREGLPKSLLEAAACGRPIVATDVPGCRDIARAGVTALLVPPDAAAPLADGIERLADDPDLRRRLGTAGRQLVEQHFSSAEIGRQIVELYDRLLRDAGKALQPRAFRV